MKKPSLILVSEKRVDHVATGAAVKKYREAKNVGQGCVASAIGQDYLTIISNLESGKRVWNETKLNMVVTAIDSCSKQFPANNKSGKKKEKTV